MASVMIIGDGLGVGADGAVAALRQSGHEVVTVGTALAVAALTVRRPEVVVLHGPMSLPDGLMALDALRSRAGLANLAAILVSTEPTPEQVARGGRCGAWRMIDRADYCPGTLAAAVDDLMRAT
jgi:CheY-like chemotaxis protein